MATEPEMIWLLDEIRNGVQELDSMTEDSLDQIPALRKIVRASVEALSQMEVRKDRFLAERIAGLAGGESLAEAFAISQNVQERS